MQGYGAPGMFSGFGLQSAGGCSRALVLAYTQTQAKTASSVVLFTSFSSRNGSAPAGDRRCSLCGAGSPQFVSGGPGRAASGSECQAGVSAGAPTPQAVTRVATHRRDASFNGRSMCRTPPLALEVDLEGQLHAPVVYDGGRDPSHRRIADG